MRYRSGQCCERCNASPLVDVARNLEPGVNKKPGPQNLPAAFRDLPGTSYRVCSSSGSSFSQSAEKILYAHAGIVRSMSTAPANQASVSNREARWVSASHMTERL